MRASFVLFVLFLSLSSFAQNINYFEAKEILKERFIEIDEARITQPELPDYINIPYSEKTLRYNVNSWLVPLLSNGVYKYMLVYAGYPLYSGNVMETCDTLSVNEAKQLVYLLGSIRPNFPNVFGYISSFDKYLFRTNEGTFSKNGIYYKKTISYSLSDKNELFVVNLPSKMVSGLVNSKYFSCLIENTLIFEPTPNDLRVENEKSIFIWDLIYVTP